MLESGDSGARRKSPAKRIGMRAMRAALSWSAHADSTPQGSGTDRRPDAAATRSHRPRRSFRDRALGESMAGNRGRGDRAAHGNRLAEIPHRSRESVGCDVDTRTEPDEVANSRARDTEAGRRRRARAAICAGTAEQARAAETAHGAARDAEIDRAAGVEGSRVAQGVRAADRGVRSEEHTSELQSLR